MGSQDQFLKKLDDYTSAEAVLQSAQEGSLQRVRSDLAWLTDAHTRLGTKIADGEGSDDAQTLFDGVEKLLDVLRPVERILTEANRDGTVPSEENIENVQSIVKDTPVDGEYIERLSDSDETQESKLDKNDTAQSTLGDSKKVTTERESTHSAESVSAESDAEGEHSDHARVVNESALRQELERLVDTLARIPSREDAIEHGSYDIDAFEQYGDSWQAVLSTAGFDLEEQLIEHLQTVHNQVDDVVTPVNLVGSTYEYGRFVHVFGDWETALDAAGLDVWRGRLLAAIQQCYSEIDRVPNGSHLAERTPFNQQEYTDEFGSVMDGIRAAGIDYKSVILDALTEAAKKIGHSPTTTEFDEQSLYSHDEIIEVFDSWDDALAAADLSQSPDSVTESTEKPESPIRPTTDGSESDGGSGDGESIAESDTPPRSPLSEWYSAIQGLQTVQHAIYEPERNDVPRDDPGMQWVEMVDAVANTRGHDDWKEGYGEQHRQRADYDINSYRETYGDGDTVTDFSAVETIPVLESVTTLAGTAEIDTLSIPITPDSALPLPVIVTSEAELTRAQSLLSELPARPALTINDSGDGNDEASEKTETVQPTDRGTPSEGAEISEREPSAEVDAKTHASADSEAKTPATDSDTPVDSPRNDPVMESLTSVNGVDRETAQTLIEAGYDGVDTLADVTTDDLTDLEGIDRGRAFRIDFALDD